ncbi:hypothetical protein AgCh_031257 [Apium graveolens]
MVEDFPSTIIETKLQNLGKCIRLRLVCISTLNNVGALPAAGHSAGTLPMKNQGLVVKFCNGELMGKKLYYSKFQRRISINNVRRSHSCMAVATSIAGEAKRKRHHSSMAACEHCGNDKAPSTLKPRQLFPVEENPPPEGSQAQRSPVKRKRRIVKDTRSRILTEKGKQVLSSDARLHLQKLRQKKLVREQKIEGMEGSNEELKILEAETKRLEAKLEK